MSPEESPSPTIISSHPPSPQGPPAGILYQQSRPTTGGHWNQASKSQKISPKIEINFSVRAGGNKTGHAVTGKGTLCPNTQEILLGTAQLQLNADGVGEKCEKWELRKRGGLVQSQVVPPGCRRSGETPCKDQLHFREMAICGKWCQERGTESLGWALQSRPPRGLVAASCWLVLGQPLSAATNTKKG